MHGCEVFGNGNGAQENKSAVQYQRLLVEFKNRNLPFVSLRLRPIRPNNLL